MKMKSFAMLAASGLAITCAYAAPALADDMSVLQLAQQDTSATDTQNQNLGNSANNSMTSNNDVNNNSDEGGPDTATGDDDY